MSDHERHARNNELAAYEGIKSFLWFELQNARASRDHAKNDPKAGEWSRFIARLGFEILALEAALAGVDVLIKERTVAEDE